MSTFVDSSALMKLYADEPGADAIRRLKPMVVSCLVRVFPEELRELTPQLHTYLVLT